MNANTNLTVVGVDLAKNVFQLHFVDEETSEVKRLKLSRQKFQQFFVNRAPCLIGMEACGGSHYWVREFLKLGHQVKVMPETLKRFGLLQGREQLGKWLLKLKSNRPF